MMVLRSDKEMSWINFCRNITNENLIDYKRKNAILNRAKKMAKVIISDPSIISNSFAQKWSAESNDSIFSQTFCYYKYQIL